MGLVVAEFGYAPQSALAERRHVYGGHERYQRDGGAYIRGGALPSDVLFARLERQDVSLFAPRVNRPADYAPGHLANVVALAGEQPDVGASERGRHSQRLPFADHYVRAVVARRPEHSQRDRIRARHQQRARVVGEFRQPLHVLHVAEEVGLLDYHAGRLFVNLRSGRRYRVYLEARSLRVRLQHVAVQRRHRVQDRHPVAPGDPRRHERRLCQRSRAVVHSEVGYVHAGQLAHEGLELERGLERSLRHLRLVWSVRRHVLAATRYLAHDRRYVMPVRPRAQEAGVVARNPVHSRQFARVLDQLELVPRRRDVQRRIQIALRHVGEKLGYRINSYGVQHLPPVRVGVRDVWGLEGLGGHGNYPASDSRNESYSDALMSALTSDSSASSTRSIQPSS